MHVFAIDYFRTRRAVNDAIKKYLKHVGKVLPADKVIGLDEDLAQRTLADRVVLAVELVKSVEGVAILEEEGCCFRRIPNCYVCNVLLRGRRACRRSSRTR